MNPDMKLHERVTAALRARFWLHHWNRHIANLSDRFPDLYSTSRSFISPASFQIFNRLCDTLILLALAYSEFYADIPFCPWLFGTEFVEHFFGIARQLLPNFSYAEFLKMVQHIMVQQRILESGVLKSKRERESASGYIFNSETDMRKPAAGLLQPARLTRPDLNRLVKIAYDEASYICREILFIPVPRLDANKPLQLRPLGAPPPRKSKKGKGKNSGDEDTENDGSISEDEDFEDEESDSEEDLADTNKTTSATPTVDEVTTLAASDSARYSALSNDLDDILAESNINACDIATPIPSPLPGFSPASDTRISGSTPMLTTSLISGLLDPVSNKMTIQQIIKHRGVHQSGTSAKSERSVVVGTKYALSKVIAVTNDAEKQKMTPKEASHRLRIVQELNPDLKKFEQKKTRQFRWESVAKSIEKALESSSSLINKNTSALQSSQLPNIASKNVTAIHLLQRDNFIIMRSEKHYYIGQILDLYKRGANSRYGSVDGLQSVQALSWISLRVFLPLQIVRDLRM